jgi:hypothetical protein
MCVFTLAPLPAHQLNLTHCIQLLACYVLHCISLLSMHLESERPLNLSALHQISVYNAGLGYHHSVTCHGITLGHSFPIPPFSPAGAACTF